MTSLKKTTTGALTHDNVTAPVTTRTVGTRVVAASARGALARGVAGTADATSGTSWHSSSDCAGIESKATPTAISRLSPKSQRWRGNEKCRRDWTLRALNARICFVVVATEKFQKL